MTKRSASSRSKNGNVKLRTNAKKKKVPRSGHSIDSDSDRMSDALEDDDDYEPKDSEGEKMVKRKHLALSSSLPVSEEDASRVLRSRQAATSTIHNNNVDSRRPKAGRESAKRSSLPKPGRMSCLHFYK